VPVTPVIAALDQTLLSVSTLVAVIFASLETEPVLAKSWRYIGQPGAVPESACDPL
jgi:hypothetical protein